MMTSYSLIKDRNPLVGWDISVRGPPWKTYYSGDRPTARVTWEKIPRPGAWGFLATKKLGTGTTTRGISQVGRGHAPLSPGNP